MKTIIAGGRHFKDWKLFCKSLEVEKSNITEVVWGCAKGADTMAKAWAVGNGIPDKPFPADWLDLSHPDAVIKTNRHGEQYDAKAGLRRNTKMAQYADALIAFWDGKSSGTAHMIKEARRLKLTVTIYLIK